MSKSERVILKSLFEKGDVDREILGNPKAIKMLFDNKYIAKATDILGSSKITITNDGVKYLQDDTEKFKTRRRQILIPITIVLLTSFLTYITSNILKKEPIQNSNIDTTFRPGELKDSTFKIENYSLNRELINTIEKESRYLYNVISQRVIEISYSGDIRMIRNNYYYYPGGYLVIKYKGSTYSLESLRIGKTLPDGTLINEINDELNRRILNITRKNNGLLSKEIISILNIESSY